MQHISPRIVWQLPLKLQVLLLIIIMTPVKECYAIYHTNMAYVLLVFSQFYLSIVVFCTFWNRVICSCIFIGFSLVFVPICHYLYTVLVSLIREVNISGVQSVYKWPRDLLSSAYQYFKVVSYDAIYIVHLVCNKIT